MSVICLHCSKVHGLPHDASTTLNWMFLAPLATVATHTLASSRCAVMCREEVADCSESAYGSLSVSDARKLMMYDSDADLLSHAKQVRC